MKLPEKYKQTFLAKALRQKLASEGKVQNHVTKTSNRFSQVFY
jgi:hypothetical protein